MALKSVDFIQYADDIVMRLRRESLYEINVKCHGNSDDERHRIQTYNGSDLASSTFGAHIL